MRIWTRSPLAVRCGSCGLEIPAGGAFLEIRLPELKASKRRCQFCAGEPEPPEVPPLSNDIVQTVPQIRADDFTPVPIVARDWKVRQAGSE